MITRGEFLGNRKSIYSKSWVPSPWALLSWGLKTIGLVGEGSWDANGRLREGELVIVENVEKMAAEVIEGQERRGQGLTDRVAGREAFVKELVGAVGGREGIRPSEKDVEVLLKFLERDKLAISYDDKVVKFRSSSATQPEPITHQDTTIASLKSLISTLTSQCDTLATRISTLTATASTAVRTSNRISALAALRSKKLAESNLKQRTDTLTQLEEIYTKIEQAADQVDILKVMEASAGVLKGLNKEVGGVEKVQDVIDGLKEEMEKVDEVGQVINEPMGARGEVDEGEIDDELEAMEKEEREKEAKRVKEREEKEAEVTRKRLEEIAQKEDLEQAEKRRRFDELEQRAKALRASTAIENDAEQLLDASTKRFSQMSIEEEANPQTQDPNRMEGVREALVEGTP